MALHGDIQVNYRTIGSWEAVRKESVSNETSHFYYRCAVVFRDLRGNTSEKRFYVTHHFSDGALVLASKVMAEAARIIERDS